jgi:hypothetical protein
MPKPAKPKSRPKTVQRKRSAKPPRRAPKPSAKPPAKRPVGKSPRRTQFQDSATKLKGAPLLPRAVLEPGMRDVGGRYLEPLSPKARRAILRYRASKLFRIVTLLRAPGGASLERLMAETGWQAHSVRGAIAGPIKRNLALAVLSKRIDGARVYAIDE